MTAIAFLPLMANAFDEDAKKMHGSRYECSPDETDRDRSCHRSSGTILPMKRLRRKAGLFDWGDW